MLYVLVFTVSDLHLGSLLSLLPQALLQLYHQLRSQRLQLLLRPPFYAFHLILFHAEVNLVVVGRRDFFLFSVGVHLFFLLQPVLRLEPLLQPFLSRYLPF